jgi:putative acetyltransferase
MSGAMSVTIARERPDSPDAATLVTALEAHLEQLYPAVSRHGYSVERLVGEGVHFFLLRSDGVAAGCGGILFAGDGVARYGEIKRMYVRPEYRGSGFGRLLLKHLVAHARSHRVSMVRLETGVYQLEAVALYEGMGFVRVPPFGPYFVDPLSLCYELRLQ